MVGVAPLEKTVLAALAASPRNLTAVSFLQLEKVAGPIMVTTSPGVPAGAISAFDISQPVGEGMLYFIIQEGGN